MTDKKHKYDTSVLSSDMQRYAGELRAFCGTLICICPAIFAPVRFHENQNLIMEHPKVKYEEEGESGLSFLSQ